MPWRGLGSRFRVRMTPKRRSNPKWSCREAVTTPDNRNDRLSGRNSRQGVTTPRVRPRSDTGEPIREGCAPFLDSVRHQEAGHWRTDFPGCSDRSRASPRANRIWKVRRRKALIRILGDSARRSCCSRAILLNPRSAQTCKTVCLERACPRKKLFFGQLIDTAGVRDRHPAATDGSDHSGLAAHNPPPSNGGRQNLVARGSAL
jgi:hypothetical protein